VAEVERYGMERASSSNRADIERRWVGASAMRKPSPRSILGHGRGSSIQLYRQNLRKPLQTICRRW
jgi:hypothetical protein